MKYVIIIFSITLLLINHHETIQKVLSGEHESMKQQQALIKGPKLTTPIDSLNTRYSRLAEKHELPQTLNIYFIVDKDGSIRNPYSEELRNMEVSSHIMKLIASAGIKPGSIAENPTSMGMGLKLLRK